MLTVDQALDRILAQATPIGARTVPLAQAAGRVLAMPVTAGTSQPPFDASAMDGYAVRADDVRAGSILELVGTSQAGAGYEGDIQPGQCVRIFTGAPVPTGADAVVMQEQVNAKGKAIAFTESARHGQSVRTRGRDFMEGDEVLAAHARLGPAAVSLIAAANRTEVSVFKRPQLALLATGDKLVAPGSTLGPGQIVGSNSYGLAALFDPVTGAITDLGVASDDEEALRTKLKAALDSDIDVLVTTGGASVGDHDLVQPVLESLGVEIDFWKIAMRPGKPLMFGTKGHKLVFGLPGNPVSALVTAIVVVMPALRKLAGYAEPRWPVMRLPLGAPLPANGPRRHFRRGRTTTGESGVTTVIPSEEIDSAHLSSMAKADCLIIQYENDGEREAGQNVEVIPLPGF